MTKFTSRKARGGFRLWSAMVALAACVAAVMISVVTWSYADPEPGAQQVLAAAQAFPANAPDTEATDAPEPGICPPFCLPTALPPPPDVCPPFCLPTALPPPPDVCPPFCLPTSAPDQTATTEEPDVCPPNCLPTSTQEPDVCPPNCLPTSTQEPDVCPPTCLPTAVPQRYSPGRQLPVGLPAENDLSTRTG